MKTLIASVLLLSLLFVQRSTSNFAPLGTSVGLGSQNRARTQEDPRTQEDRRREDFEKGKSLLVDKNVPFDPEILLTPHWRETLKSTFNQMPELQEVRRGTNRLKGVQIAHTLYLPEKVQLEGDTVILARNLIFDGHEAVIRGPFNIYVYPIDECGLLGTSFEVALARARPKTDVRFITASWVGNRALPVMPIIGDGTIRINTSGLGRADWLESQQAMAGGGGRMIKAGFFQQGQNHNGAYTGDGGYGVEGNQGVAGTQGNTGADGTCGSSSSVNGKIGFIGTVGLIVMEEFPGPVEKGGRAALVEKAVLAGWAPTAIVTREVLVTADKVAPATLAVQVAQAVLAAGAEPAVPVPTLPSATPNVMVPATSLAIRIPDRANRVLPVAYLETQESADRAERVVRTGAHQNVIWPFSAQPVTLVVPVQAAPRARLVRTELTAPSLAR